MPVGATYKINGWENEVISFNGKLTIVICPSCHIVHALPEELDRRAVMFNSGDYPRHYVTIHCPNGHAWHYTEDTELVKERRARERAEEALAYTQDRLNSEKRSHAATKGQLTKVTKRIHEGVCPECNRTFKQLARHMRSKHKGAADAHAMADEMRGR